MTVIEDSYSQQYPSVTVALIPSISFVRRYLSERNLGHLRGMYRNLESDWLLAGPISVPISQYTRL